MNERHIDILKIQSNKETGEQHLTIVLDNGDFIYVPYDAAAEQSFKAWQNGEIDEQAFLNKVDQADTAEAAETIAETFNVRLARISDHLTTDGYHVFFDGATFDKIQLDEYAEDHLIRLMRETKNDAAGKHDFQCFAAFVENLYCNVKPYIREQLAKWLAKQGLLTFTEDGCFIGYRGCQKNPVTGEPESVHCGPGMVDDVYYNGHIPNPVGARVSIDRSMVVDNPAVGCAVGMHVGTYEYAESWSQGYLLTVKVNPRDVISVPVDCDCSKIRCCAFEVLEAKEYQKYRDSAPYDVRRMSYRDDDSDWNDEDDEWWDDEDYDEDYDDYENYDTDDGWDDEGEWERPTAYDNGVIDRTMNSF